MASSPDGSEDINVLVGARVRTEREALGLSQRAFAEKIGVSYNKIYTLEQGKTRMLVSDLIEIAAGLGVSPWILVQDIAALADLRPMLEARYRELARETDVVIDQFVAAHQWIERRWRIKLRLPYCPIYHFHPERPPIEFVEAWENPTLNGGRKYLYVQQKEGQMLGCFFEAEIVPSNSLEHSDTPAMSGDETWEDKGQLERFLEGNGYCWQLYPVRIHHEEYCGPEHRAEIEVQRRSRG
jgi:transcriptional regulator with XRE-family HTH domain